MNTSVNEMLLWLLQVHSVSRLDWTPYLILVIGTIINFFIASNKKLDAANEQRLEKLESACQKLSDNSLTDGDLSQLKENVKDALSRIREIEADRERRSAEMSQELRKIDNKFYTQDKQVSDKLDAINLALNRILPK